MALAHVMRAAGLVSMAADALIIAKEIVGLFVAAPPQMM